MLSPASGLWSECGSSSFAWDLCYEKRSRSNCCSNALRLRESNMFGNPGRQRGCRHLGVRQSEDKLDGTRGGEWMQVERNEESGIGPSGHRDDPASVSMRVRFCQNLSRDSVSGFQITRSPDDPIARSFTLLPCLAIRLSSTLSSFRGMRGTRPACGRRDCAQFAGTMTS